jgi:hypothetical protein
LVSSRQPDAQNNPLFLDSFLERRTEDDVLRFSYIVHCALDAIEERGARWFPAAQPLTPN